MLVHLVHSASNGKSKFTSIKNNSINLICVSADYTPMNATFTIGTKQYLIRHFRKPMNHAQGEKACEQAKAPNGTLAEFKDLAEYQQLVRAMNEVQVDQASKFWLRGHVSSMSSYKEWGHCEPGGCNNNIHVIR